MGVVYKLTQEIIDFIVEEKQSNPRLGCRKLVDIVKERFDRDVSKSSINTIIKKANLSSPVGRRTSKTSKEDNFKIPTAKKQELLTEAKRYIDDTLLSSPKKKTIESTKKPEPGKKESKAAAKKDVKKETKKPVKKQVKKDIKEEVVEEIELPSVPPPMPMPIAPPVVEEQKQKTEAQPEEPVKKEKKAPAKKDKTPKVADAPSGMLQWEENDDDMDHVVEQTDEPVTLRPDPLEVMQPEQPQIESPQVDEQDSDAAADELTPNRRVFPHMGGLLFKVAQWQISHKPLLFNTLRSRINNFTEEDLTLLADWLPAAKLFNHDTKYIDNGALTETEAFIYDDITEKHMVDLVQAFAEIEDGFGFGLDLDADLNMAFTAVKKVGLRLSKGEPIALQPDLSGLIKETTQGVYLLDYVLNDLADRLVNSIEPLVLDTQTQSDLEDPAFLQLCQTFNLTGDTTIEEVVVYVQDDQEVTTFNNVPKQKRGLIFGVDSKSDVYQEVMKNKDQYAQAKTISVFGTSSIMVSKGAAGVTMDGFSACVVSSPLFDEERVLVTNLDDQPDMYERALMQWVVRFAQPVDHNEAVFEPLLPDMMDINVASHKPTEHIDALRDLIYSYFQSQFLPKSLQGMDLSKFIADISLMPAALIEQDKTIFIEYRDLPATIHTQDFDMLLQAFNRAYVRDMHGRALCFFLQK